MGTHPGTVVAHDSTQANGNLIIASAILLTVAFRLPFLLDNINFNNDAHIYSDNIHHEFFDGRYWVQMPGYVGYIYLGRLLHEFTENTTAIQHLINLVLVGLITLTFFRLLEEFKLTLRECFAYSLLVSFNPILLLGSITGGNRLFLTLASIVLIHLAAQIYLSNRHDRLSYFGFYLAFFMAFRQDLAAYFVPLYAFLCYKTYDAKLVARSLLYFGATCLIWLIPLVLEYGGFAAYLAKVQNYNAVKDTSVLFSGVALSPLLNIARILIYMFNAFLFAVPIIGYLFYRGQWHIDRKIWLLLALSFFPAFLFQALVHNGNYVQLAAFMVPIYLLVILNFRINTRSRTLVSAAIGFLLLFQFFGVRMIAQPDNLFQKLANVVWLQYTYDGAKTGQTLRLKGLEKDAEPFLEG